MYSIRFLDQNMGFFSYLWSELSRGYIPDENEAVYNVKKERVYTFVQIPKECEKASIMAKSKSELAKSHYSVLCHTLHSS